MWVEIKISLSFQGSRRGIRDGENLGKSTTGCQIFMSQAFSVAGQAIGHVR
jgi:hypothetical protein